MANYLTENGLTKLVNNIKAHFEPKKKRCQLYYQDGIWYAKVNDEIFNLENQSDIFFSKIGYDSSNVIFDVLKGGDIPKDCFNVAHQYDYDGGIVNLTMFVNDKIDTGENNIPIDATIEININIEKGDTFGAVTVQKTYNGTINIGNAGFVHGYLDNSEAIGSEYGVYGHHVMGYVTNIFNMNNGTCNYPDGKYVLMFEGEYVGDCIIKGGDSEGYIVIKKAKGCKYYFAKAQQYTMEDGEESYQPTYFGIYLFDGEQLGDNFNAHILSHNPHKDDDVIEPITNGCLSWDKTNQGLSKMLTEYYEGNRKYSYIDLYRKSTVLPVVSFNDGLDSNFENLVNAINQPCEVSTMIINGANKNWLNDQTGILTPYIANANGVTFEYANVIPYKTVYLVNQTSEELVVPLCIENVYNDDIKGCFWGGSEGMYQCVKLKVGERCKIEIVVGSVYSEVGEAGGPLHESYDCKVYVTHETELVTQAEVAENEYVTALGLTIIKENVGLNDGGLYEPSENANYVSSATTVVEAIDILDTEVSSLKKNVNLIQLNGATSYTLSNIEWGKIYKLSQNDVVNIGLSNLIISMDTRNIDSNAEHYEVLIEFDCNIDNMTLTVPSELSWANDEPPVFHNKWHYQLTITAWYNVFYSTTVLQGVCVGFPMS